SNGFGINSGISEGSSVGSGMERGQSSGSSWSNGWGINQGGSGHSSSSLNAEPGGVKVGTNNNHEISGSSFGGFGLGNHNVEHEEHYFNNGKTGYSTTISNDQGKSITESHYSDGTSSFSTNDNGHGEIHYSNGKKGYSTNNNGQTETFYNDGTVGYSNQKKLDNIGISNSNFNSGFGF
ncbi:MAG: hypothetical protein ACOCV1_06330, partial [Bacillota bacterium]